MFLGDLLHWVLHDVVSNDLTYNNSNKQGLVDWEDDDTLTLTGKHKYQDFTKIINVSISGELTYPETVTVSSTGGASEKWFSEMGVYKITNITHSGRPVWQSTVRDDSYLFYNGNNIPILMIYNN